MTPKQPEHGAVSKLNHAVTGIDALTIFTFLWSNIAVLQCVKQFHSLKQRAPTAVSLPDTFLFFLLAASIIYSATQPHRSLALVFLCSSHIISLVYFGSQSNHVIMAIVIASAVLIDYSSDRIIWQKRLSGTTYMIMVILYLVSFTHKLNEDWFNHTISCASLFASGFLSMWISLPTDLNTSFSYQFADLIIRTAPKQAVTIEIALPTLLILWRISTKKISSTIFSIMIITGALFHLIICLPLPPLSVYPFSMVMVPMYVLMLPSESIQRIKSMISNTVLTTGLIAIFAVLVKAVVKLILKGEEMPLEYPAYGLWTTAVVWNIIVWVIIVYAALSIKPSRTSEFPSFIFRSKGVLVALFLGFIGICPYLGIRNYPALAMFSNLRTEGTSPNHIVLPPMGILGYQYDTVHVQSTNLKSLQDYQVNLALYFSDHTKKFNTAFGITNEFWITPPSWSPPDARSVQFVPFSIPVLELRKHISNQVAQDFYVNFTMGGDPHSVSHVFYSSDPGSYDQYGHLTVPVNWVQRVLFRFRSFDSNRSPCRH